MLQQQLSSLQAQAQGVAAQREADLRRLEEEGRRELGRVQDRLAEEEEKQGRLREALALVSAEDSC